MYYYLGRHLKNLKSLYKLQDYSAEEFYDFIFDRYRKKKLYNKEVYIRFTDLCNDHPILLQCNLGFDEIMKNTPEILATF